MAHALIEIGQEGGGFGGDHGSFAIGTRKCVNGGERCPVRSHKNFHGAGSGTRANRCPKEAFDALQLRLHGYLEVLQIGV